MTTRSCPKCSLLMARCDFKYCPDCGARLDSLSPSDATDCSPRLLAEKIADRLFTNGFGDEGNRLEIKSGVVGRHSERSLGGWCRQAAVDQIEKAILVENDKSAGTDTSAPKI